MRLPYHTVNDMLGFRRLVASRSSAGREFGKPIASEAARGGFIGIRWILASIGFPVQWSTGPLVLRSCGQNNPGTVGP